MLLNSNRLRAALRKVGASCALTALIATTCVAMSPSYASAASGSGTMLLEDSFRNSSVTSDQYKIGGRSFTPCLTASGAANPNPSINPRQCSGASDSSGSGALRLTDAVTNRAGFMLYDHALPTKAGLDIEFRFYEYGGTGGAAGADGISFFLTKGTSNLTAPGAYGGSLGYHFNPTQDGIADALLGVGLDAWGNFGVETNDPSCVAKTGITPPTNQVANANTVGIRGPGNGRSGYCLLAQPKPYSGGIGLLGGNRTTALRKARIVIDPPTTSSPKVKVYVASGESGDVSDSTTPLLTVAEPAEFKTNPTFKFGWAASTGGSTNIHEINFLEVASVIPIPPELEITADNAPAANAGQVSNVVIRPSISSSGGPESKDITVNLTRNGVEYASAPSGTGWSCNLVSSEYKCVYAVSSMLISGTTLPPITVPLKTVTDGQTGNFSGVSASVTSTDNYYSTPKSVTATASWRPVIGNSTGTGIASVTPTAITLSTPSIAGSPISGYEIVSAPSSADGTASISNSGIPSFTPAAGASGVTTFTYRALGAGGVQSLTNGTATVTVSPVAYDRSASTVANTAVSIPNSQAPLGTGPFTYTVTQPASGGTAAINPSTGVITFTPTTGFSGVATFSYTAKDSDGVASAAKTVTVDVAPIVSGTTLDFTLDSDGEGSGTTSAPSTTGSSPFTFTKTKDPDSGQATVNSSTGAVTYTAETGVSGRFTVDYSASSGGVTSASATANVTVHPYLSTVSGATDADSELALPAPAAVGAGPLVFTVASPSKGSASIAPDTGEITFDPQGHSGTVTVDYTVRDASGVDTTRTATISVAPTVSALTKTVAASKTPSAIAMNATPHGDGPWTYQIVTGLDSELGTVSATSSGVQITPAAGVSGEMGVTYRVKGADGLWSQTQTATLTVTPVVAASAIEISLDSHGEATGTVTVPTPIGSGPFEFGVVSGPAKGHVEVDAETGEIAYSIDDGSTGIFTATYSATDADGVVSNTATVNIIVRPYLAVLEAATDADAAVVIDGPDAIGTPQAGYTGLQFTIPTQPAKGSATIDEDTGVIVYDPQGHSGIVDFVYTVEGADNLTSTRTVTITVRPSLGALADTAAASDSPAAIGMVASPLGDGPFTYEIVTGPSADKGAVAATSDGVEVTPGAGVSGVLRSTYRVKGADDVWSNAASATLTVTPTALDGTRSVSSGTKTVVDFPQPVGVGPFHYEVVSGLPTGWGTAKVVTTSKGAERLSLDISKSRSGMTQITYKVTDLATLESQVATLGIQVSPVASDLDMGTTRAKANGDESVTSQAPTPNGSGPFSYEIVTNLPMLKGTAVIDPVTGRITVTPRNGASGKFTFTYRVTDASSLTSTVATVTLLVAPSASAMAQRAGSSVSGGSPDTNPGAAPVATRARTTGRAPVTISAATPVGTGPFTYRLVSIPDPSQGTVTIDPKTGEITFVAAAGFHGTVKFTYEVVDADGLVSEPQVGEVEVLGEQVARNSEPPRSTRPRSLAFTGASPLGGALAGAVLVLAGVAVVFAERRRYAR